MNSVEQRITQFAEKMKKEGRTLSIIDGGAVSVSPTDGIAAFDMMEMVRLNTKGRLAAYVLANKEK